MMNMQSRYKVKFYQKVVQTILLQKAQNVMRYSKMELISLLRSVMFFVAEWRMIYKKWHKAIVKI